MLQTWALFFYEEKEGLPSSVLYHKKKEIIFMEKDTLLNIRKNAANTPLHEKHRQIDLAKKKSEQLEIENELRRTYIELIDDKLFSAASDDSLMDKPIQAIVKLTGTNELDEIVVESLREYYEANKMNFSYDKKEQAIRVSIAEAPENEACLGSLLLATKIRTASSGKYAAVVYIDDLYDKFVNGESIDSIVKTVVKLCNANTPSADFDINNYDEIRPHLFMSLVNAELNENNKDLLAEPFLDLLKIVKIIVPDKRNSGLITVKKDMLDIWEKTATEVFADAMSAKNPYTALTHSPVSIYLMGEDDNIPMEFVTNEIKSFGAGAILYDDKAVLKELAEKYDADLVIMPSSVHEVLTVPYTEDVDIDYIKNTIKNINDSLVNEKDILSYSAYKYSRDTNQVEIL